MNRWYRIALISGTLPLLVGVSIFTVWIFTRWDWLIGAGILTLYGGVVIFCVGAVALARFSWLAFGIPELPRRRLWIATVACAALLLSNFVVAGCIIPTVMLIEARYTVIIHNASEQPLSGVRVFGGGCEIEYGTIPPDGVARRSFWIQHDGELQFRARSGSMTYIHTIDGYVTNNMGGKVTITVNADNTISVVDNDA
jgi:hypothetical protein